MRGRTIDLQVGPLIIESENLVERVIGGDQAAFRLMFEQNHRLVLRFLYAMVGRRDIAEELTQETFIGAFKNIRTLKDEAKLSSWLCGIARNTAYNWLRTREVKNRKFEIDPQTVDEFQDAETAPDSELLRGELKQVVRQALSKLDADKRTVFTLKILQQRSYAEIAEITGFSIPKLKTDLHRAKAEMRDLIRPYLEKSDEV